MKLLRYVIVDVIGSRIIDMRFIIGTIYMEGRKMEALYKQVYLSVVFLKHEDGDWLEVSLK